MQKKCRLRSPENFAMVASPSGSSPCTARPMPDSKCVLNEKLRIMSSGTVQCASSISPVCGSMRDGFAWKPHWPVRALPIAIVIRVGTSPSHPDGMPSALSIARARQPVFWTAVSRSKQRRVSPESEYFLIIFFKAQ